MAVTFTHQLLKTELTTDPLAVGYSGMSHNVAASTLNDRSRGRTVDRRFVDRNEVLAAIVLSDYADATVTATQRNWLALVASADVLDIRSSNVRAGFLSIFGAATATRANLVALQTRPGSRAEELWGEDFTVTADDVAFARSL